MAIRKNSKRTVEVIQQLVRWKNERTGIFANSSLPETLLPKGVEKGSYEQIMFITMCSSIDYQRDADALWDAGRDTWNDEKRISDVFDVKSDVYFILNQLNVPVDNILYEKY